MPIMQLPNIVVGGIPELAQQLQNTNQFPAVFSVNSTSEVVGITKELKGLKPKDVVFIFGDTIKSDFSISLREIIRKFTDGNYNVIIVTLTSQGHDLHLDNPRTGEINLPFTLNKVLFAIKSYGFDVNVDESPNGYKYISSSSNIFPQSPTPMPKVESPWVAPVVPAQASSPTFTPPTTNVKPSGGWSDPTSDITPPNYTEKPNFNPPPAAVDPAPFESKPIVSPFSSLPLPPAHPESNPTPTFPQQSFSQPTTNAQSQKPSLADFLPPQTNPQNLGGFNPPQSQPQSTPQNLSGFNPPQSQPQSTPNNFTPPVRRSDAPNLNQNSNVRRKGFVITVAVAKGGVGKSSLTLNLAAFLGMKLRKLNRTICVIDANFQQADAGKYLDTYTPNITEISRDPSILSRDRINEVLVSVPKYNLSVLLGPDNPDDADPSWLRARLFVQILDLLKEKFDYIFIDTPVAEKYHEIFQQFALPEADYIICPVSPNFTTLYNTDNWLRSAVTAPTSSGGANFDKHKIGIVLNQAQEDVGCSEQDVRQTLHEWNFIGSIPFSQGWIKAGNEHELVAGKNFHDIHAVFAEILNHATGEPALLDGLEIIEEKKKGIFSIFRKGK